MIKPIVSRSILIACSFLAIFLITQSCEKEEIKLDNYFPVGRTSVLNNEFVVISNSQELTYELVYDSCGGYWLKFNSSQLENRTEVIIKFTSTNQETDDFVDSTRLENWLKPSYYIDSDEESITNKAQELTEGLSTIMEKATIILQYTDESIEPNSDPYKPADVKASKTLEEGFGVCINYSRLFIALCRAAGVPSRSVWGIVAGRDGLFHHHHQWAEVCDENGIWHICDFGNINGFFNNDIGRVDLIFGAEENSTITGFKGWTSRLDDVVNLHNYPEAYTGSIPNFEMVSQNWPDSIVVECTIKF